MSDLATPILAPPEPAMHGDAAHIIRVGDLRLDELSDRASWRDDLVKLTLTEYRIVRLLALAGRDVRHREIYDVVHGPGFLAGDGEEGYRVNVRSAMKRIRKKFAAIDPQFSHIQAYPGFGYAWRSAGA